MKKLFKLFIILFLCSLFFSCDDESPEIVTITLESDKDFIVADGTETITFTVKTEDETDVTSDCTFKVNGELLTGNTFQTSATGSYNCIAEYKSSTSDALKFYVKEIPVFVKNILIENYTAVWCGYCPRVHDAIKDAIEKDSHVIPVAIHGSDDPYYFNLINSLASKFKVTGYPTAMIDRDYSWPYPETYNGLNKALENNAALGLAITSEISGNNIIANVKVKFGKTFTNDLSLVVCLVENDLINDQANYYEDGRGNPIEDYEHDNVLRKFGTDLFGDEIPGTSTTDDSEYTKQITFDASGYVKEKCAVVAFVVNAEDKVLNVQKVASNGSQDYQPLAK